MTEALIDFPTIETVPMPAAAPPIAAVAKTAAIADSISAVHGEVAKFDQIAAGLARIEAAHPKNVIVADIATSAGFKVAETGWRAYRNPRLEVERARKAAKAPVLALGKAIDTFAGELETRLRDGEDHYKAQIDAEETRRAAEKAEAPRILAERQAKQADGVASIRAYLSRAQTAADMTADRVANGINMLEGMTFSPDDWLDTVAAASAQCEILEGMRALHTTLLAREEAAAAAEAQRLENERVAAELAEQKRKADAEQKRIAGCMARIAEIRAAATGHDKASSADLAEARVAVAAMDVSEAIYAEFTVLAEATQAATLAALDGLRNKALEREEAAALAVTRATLTPAPAPCATPPFAGYAGHPIYSPENPPPEFTEGQGDPQVLKAEPVTADATAGSVPADASPRVGAMGAGYAADAAPAAEPEPEPVPVPAEPDPLTPEAAFLALVMSAFDCKFPSHPKPSATWWAEVRAAGQNLQGL